ncbi:chitin disaccharide deacetylase [Peribacillus psychrosaccharolyticus]|uniref:Chitin disaccharide deacetylase n=1 Tax=Peribacillus psychrosaccharolyticus TaxID=1407 RepID=A0A974NN56_PERPY|nr:chitin disaccharide deacetylase [Peribacillus psychrosaccharolyticus]MEC2055832.1 chitin disaccharide deacetylase [Peribacillus psychrosaccharolyticus]MED3743007.1 chitin disaccharide deacetylase [Peribacillus psychrosaccharolyticus]QQT00935.1 chitin disaccharide deacetylase [Peribacillus psychrosaccharolyticus]
MIDLLVNADDFGFSRGVNHGIIDCHKYGIVNSTTIMMNAAATQHAIELAKNTPTLKVGIHLVLTWGKPLLSDVPSMVDEDGFFKKQSILIENPTEISLHELEREWSAQIDLLLATGLVPTHLDSHHHVHGIKALYPIVKKLSDYYHLPVRKAAAHFEDIETVSDIFMDDFYGEGVVADYFDNLNSSKMDGKSLEIMTHPAYLDTVLLEGTSYTTARLREMDILINTQLPRDYILRK